LTSPATPPGDGHEPPFGVRDGNRHCEPVTVDAQRESGVGGRGRVEDGLEGKEQREAGHEAIAVDLPGDDPDAGLPEYTRLVAGAIGDRGDVVLVAQSLAGSPRPWSPHTGPDRPDGLGERDDSLPR
jgi:hypothetical protein